MTKTDGPYARAERGSRWVLWVVCVGALAWGLGSLVAVNLREALEPVIDVETGLGLIVVHWCFQHLWLLVALAPMAAVAGRLVGGGRAPFVAVSVATGELLDLSLATLRDGSPFDSWEDVAGWAVGLALFVVPVALAFAYAAAASARAQAEALDEAKRHSAGYAVFAEKAEHRGDSPSSPD